MVTSMACLPSHVLYILALSLACSVGTTVAQCDNYYNNSHCASTIAQGDYCRLESRIRCNCARDCNARPKCTGESGDTDQLCDCPFYAFRCDNPAMAWYRTFCPYTCGIRDTVTCQTLMEVAGASPLFNNQPPGNSTPRYMDAVTWQCDTGWHQVTGPASQRHKRMCVTNGSWLLHPEYQSPTLVCARDNCGAVPAAPALTTPTSSSGVFEDTVNYTCNVGYTNTGQDQGTHKCNASAVWERLQPDPVCTVVQCGAPPTVANAVPSASSGPYQTLITYSCLTGYVSTGTSTGDKMCNATGHWVPAENKPDIVCTGRSCGASPFVIGAAPSVPTGFYPGTVNYTCKAGYVLTGGGTGKMKCTADGIWQTETTDPAPLCLGEFTVFVNSENEIQKNPGPAPMASVSARSKLHCASLCAASVHCHGFNFTRGSGDCSMNMGSPLPVISTMKKLYK